MWWWAGTAVEREDAVWLTAKGRYRGDFEHRTNLFGATVEAHGVITASGPLPGGGMPFDQIVAAAPAAFVREIVGAPLIGVRGLLEPSLVDDSHLDRKSVV